MNISKQTETNTNTYDSPGSRLSHILDQIGFKQGRGRVIDFQNYLREKKPEDFESLKYSTVRAWFQDHAPPMNKIDIIIEALQVKYQFQNDVSHIKTWWKAGGFYPFVDKASMKSSSLHELQKKIAAVKEKLPFVIMSIITEETGDHFKSLSGSDLISISDKVTGFAEGFLDPFTIDCPDEYLRFVVRQELSKVLERATG
jgi:signal recognition particle subunit SEC65